MPFPAKDCLPVFKLPPVTHAPMATSAFHASESVGVPLSAPLLARAAVAVPAGAVVFLATAKSFCSDQLVPFHNSVAPVLPGLITPPKPKAAV